MQRAAVALVVMSVGSLMSAGCSKMYYKTWEKLGWEKRDILVDRVKDARESQDEAQKQFETSLERFRDTVAVEGGSLEDKYKKLNDELERSEDRAKKVKDRVNAVRDVSKDLFKEWDSELGKYSDRTLR